MQALWTLKRSAGLTSWDPNSRRQQSYSETSKLNQAVEFDPATRTSRISAEVPSEPKVDYKAEHGRNVSRTDLHPVAFDNCVPIVEEINEALDGDN